MLQYLIITNKNINQTDWRKHVLHEGTSAVSDFGKITRNTKEKNRSSCSKYELAIGPIWI
jgi:hypothetical protein